MTSTSTRWKFDSTRFSSLYKIANRLLTITTPNMKSNISQLDVQLYPCFFNKNNSHITPLKISMINRSIEFLVYKITYVVTTLNGNLTHRNYFLILYKLLDKNIIYAIINKNSGSLVLLRSILGFTGKGELTSANISISNDFILWVLKQFYNKKRAYYNKSLVINHIIQFSGRANNTDNRITIKGSDTMDLLSTLSFLLESKILDRVTIKTQCNNHKNFNLQLSTNNTIGITKYLGPYTRKKYQNKYGSDCPEFLPYLFAYCVLVPRLLVVFNKSDSTDKTYIKFLKELIKGIYKRVRERIEDIKNGMT